MRVLIVDESPDAGELAGELLKRVGHECRTAKSGAEALAEAEVLGPDLVILDIVLPDVDGCQLAHVLRSRLGAKPPYLVAMSGWSHAMQRARDAGFDDWLLKPVSRPQLLRAVDLAKQRRAAP